LCQKKGEFLPFFNNILKKNLKKKDIIMQKSHCKTLKWQKKWLRSDEHTKNLEEEKTPRHFLRYFAIFKLSNHSKFIITSFSINLSS
jgi:hypothetical protein